MPLNSPEVQPPRRRTGLLAALALLFLAAFIPAAYAGQWLGLFAGLIVAGIVAVWLAAALSRPLPSGQVLSADTAATRELRVTQEALAQVEAGLRLMDDDFPDILFYVDRECRLQFGNRAFEYWANVRREAVRGRMLESVIGQAAWVAMRDRLEQALQGQFVRAESSVRQADGKFFRFADAFIPRYSDKGDLQGAYCLLHDITERNSLPESMEADQRQAGVGQSPGELYADSMAEGLTGWDDPVQRVVRALDEDQFVLYGQTIEPTLGSTATPLVEILVRLREEEEAMTPPGAFIPVLEHYNLMPLLDRWVVKRLLRLIREEIPKSGAHPRPVFSINISRETAVAPDFTDFVRHEALAAAVSPTLLCFEVTERDVLSDVAHVGRLARQLREVGCATAISNFGGESTSFDLLKKVPVSYIKIDGSLTRNVGRDQVSSSRVRSICRVAEVVGIRTIGEFVEDEKLVEQLRDLGVNLVQGFGISSPEPLSGLAERISGGGALR